MPLGRAHTQYEQSDMPTDLHLGSRIVAYIAALTRHASGFIEFRTGAGRIFRDLLLHWPTLENWEDEAHELCERIADAVYPLTGALYAQAVDLQIAISPAPLSGPECIDALATYVVFDRQACCERRFFLSPRLPLPTKSDMQIDGGIAVLCRPLHYRYHTIKDDRQRKAHPRIGMFELPQRLINELYDAPDFVPHERRLIASLATQIAALPLRLRQNRATAESRVATARERTPTAAPPRLATALSALPPPVRAVERRLMAAATDKRAYTPPLRVGLRRVAQSIRILYPIVLIDEAARQETARRAALPSMRAFFIAPELAAKVDKRHANMPYRAKAVKPDLALRADLLRREYALPAAILAEAKAKRVEQRIKTPQELPRATVQEIPKANKAPERQKNPQPEKRTEETPARKPQEPSSTPPKTGHTPDAPTTPPRYPENEAARAVLKNENAAQTQTAPAPPMKSLWCRWLSVPTLAPLPLVSRLFGRK